MRNLQSSMGIPIDKIEYRRNEMERAFPAANVPAPPTLVFRASRLVMKRPLGSYPNGIKVC
jgi:hypothetical protein